MDGPGGLSDDEDDIEEDEPLHEEDEEPTEAPGPVEEGVRLIVLYYFAFLLLSALFMSRSNLLLCLGTVEFRRRR